MRKMGVKLTLLGAFAGAALLAGCEDNGRSWAQFSQQEDYYPQEQGTHVRLHRGSNVGVPRHLPLTPGDAAPEPGTGGAGFAATEQAQRKAVSEAVLHATDAEQDKLWLQQDQRVPFPPSSFSAQAALELGTGRPLRTGPNGAWIQGTRGVELGSGIARTVASSSGSAQPQEPAVGEQALPKGSPGEGTQAPEGQSGQPDPSGGMAPPEQEKEPGH